MKDVDGAAFRQLQDLRDELSSLVKFMRETSRVASGIPEDRTTFDLLGKSDGYWYGKSAAFKEAADWLEEML
jgi:hypothetical protein